MLPTLPLFPDRRPARPLWAAALLLALLALLPLSATPAGAVPFDDTEKAELADWIRAHYAKHEYRIPMRDGRHLFTAVYVPNDRSRTYPILMKRTPYGIHPYGADRYPDELGPAAPYAGEGFIFVYQDVRGRYMSEGEFVNMRPHRAVKSEPADVDESTDTHDTIEWLLEHVPGHNGRVGLWGISYPGFYVSAGLVDSHPALVAASPQAPIADWFWDDMHHHGAFVLPLAFRFLSSFGQARPEPTTEKAETFDIGTPDGYGFYLELGPLANVDQRYFRGEIGFWNELVAHPNYDEFWQARNILPHLTGVGAAVLTVGGWYDTEDLYGPLETYQAIERQNPGIWNGLVMGPWRHGGWSRTDGRSLGAADFGFATSPGYLHDVELPFFRHFLKGDPSTDRLDLPEALVFETGANRWRRFAAWPPAEVEERTLYLHSRGGLDWRPPTSDVADETVDDGADRFVSDPAKPVPYTMEITNRWARDYMTEDQRFAAWRPDVLVYQSEPLGEDLTLAGPLEAELFVSTTGTAADWIVKVIDVFPAREPGWGEPAAEDGVEDLGGTQRLVRAEAFRGRFRNSYEHPEPFVPGEVARVAFELQDVLHTFQRGHRIMVQIQSTWFPFIDRNPQTYVPNIFLAREEDFVAHTHIVHRSAAHPSAVQVRVLPAIGGSSRPGERP